MLPHLKPKEEHILQIIVRAERAGGALTISQLRERLGSDNRGGNLHATLNKLEANGLIMKERGAAFGAAVTLRRAKARAE